MDFSGLTVIKLQRCLNGLGPRVDPDKDPKKMVAMRSTLTCIRDEIILAKKAFIIVSLSQVRRVALKKLIEEDYNRYMKELRKFDFAITRTQP